MNYQQVPICGGFGNAESMLAWTAGNDPINVCSVPLAARPAPSGTRIMINGPQYTPGFDGVSQGGNNIDVFNFDYWQYVDVVIAQGTTYSIPAVGWMNACHRNGVLIMGSIMLYWQPGFEDFKTNILASDTTATTAANQLAAIAQYYGFDGWFLDVESFSNTGGGGGTVNPKILQTFLQTLRAAMQTVTPNGIVTCYDCVSNTGVVDNYENELDSVNEMYFQNGTTIVSDAFMPNGDWGSQQLTTSVSTAQKLGRSPLEVYMECFTSGGVDTYQQVQQCADAGLSAAPYSAGWTFANRTDEVSFEQLQEEFWGTGLTPQTGIGSVITPRPVPTALPFCTTFNTGVGRSFTWPIHATLSYGGFDWNNLSLQDIVPTYRNAAWATTGADAFTLNSSLDAAFDGGASLLIAAGSSASQGDYTIFSVYDTAWPLANGMQVSYTFLDAASGSTAVALALLLSDQQTALLLAPKGSSFSSVAIGDYTVVPVAPSSTESVQSGGQSWSQLSFDIPSTYAADSVVQVLVIPVVLANTTLPAASPQIYLGQIVVTEADGLQTQSGSVTNLTIDSAWQTSPRGVAAVNLELSWTAPSTGTVRGYDISFTANGSQLWVGRTVATTFWLGSLTYVIPPGGSDELTFNVQVIGGNGVEQSVSDAASATFTFAPPD
jgi:mannosyl-glycoprotein endo-beta-N-acetylglucosaminidase